MSAPITSLYAALLAPLYLFLSYRVIRQRYAGKVAIGMGGRPALERAARVHANFAEYAPFALLLMLLAETGRCPPFALHAAGLALLAGRAAHAYGVSQENEDLRFRTAGIATTFTVIGALALFLLARSVGV